MDNKYQRANVWVAMFLFLFSPGRYQQLAARHNIAINLESPDLGLKYKEGTYCPDMLEFLSHALQSSIKLRSSLSKSFASVFITFLIAVLVGYFGGSIAFSLPISWHKMINVFAGFLLTWSTLFELGWGLRTWKGEALHELVHSLLFKFLFISGSLLLMIALLS